MAKKKKTIAPPAKTKKIIVPLGWTMPYHLEFEVCEMQGDTFTVIEHTCGDVPDIYYTGFPSRRDAEKFVLAQPEPWE